MNEIVTYGKCLLRQLTYRPALYHSGQRKGKWSKKGQQYCALVFAMDVSPLYQAVPWKLLALSPLARSPSKKAVH